jgi:hypothetical protein
MHFANKKYKNKEVLYYQNFFFVILLNLSVFKIIYPTNGKNFVWMSAVRIGHSRAILLKKAAAWGLFANLLAACCWARE